MSIGLMLLPVLVLSGAVFGVWLGLGWLVGRAWEREAEARGKRYRKG